MVPMSGATTPDRVAAPRAPRLGYIPALDGLRAVAVAAVLLYHGDQHWIPGGFLGVDVFFVISGYLITCLLLSDWREHGHIQMARFWSRRARRLLPALFTMLGVVSLYALLFLRDDVAKLRGEVLAAALYVQNWYLIFRHMSYFESTGRPPLLQHVWSLAVEEQFYLIWPLLLACGLAMWGKKRQRLLLAILGGIVVSAVLMAVLYVPYTDPSRVYYGSDTRAFALLVGAALAFVWAPWRLTKRTGRGAPLLYDAVGAAAIAVLCWFFLNTGEFDPGLYRGGFLLVAVVTAVAIAAVVHPASRAVPFVLGMGLLRWIGIRSYGIYLWHWPVYMVTRPHSDVPITGLPLLVIRLTITLCLAELSFRYIEEPIRHGAIRRRVAAMRRARGEPRRRMAFGFALSGAAITLSVLVIAAGLIGAEPARPPAGQAEAAVVITPSSTTTTTTVPGATSTQAPATTTTTTLPPQPAAVGPPTVAGRVTAIGDSVMLGAANALQARLGAGLWLDAKQNRQFSEGVAILRSLRDTGQLGSVVVVQLGTNGTVDPAAFDDMMQICAGARRVVIVNAKVPRPWEDQVNGTFSDGVKRYKNAVLLDWHTIGGAHPEYFWDDAIHLRPEGAAAYAELIAGSL
jgi:peptidoglycan/LPS O-acetylase OafA/YrhL